MKRVTVGAIASVVAGTLFAVAGVSAANATTEYPEGGTWNYGVHEPAGTYYVYSNYYHPFKLHRSSVQVTNGTIYRSADKAGGSWTYLDEATGWSGNHAYYYVY